MRKVMFQVGATGGQGPVVGPGPQKAGHMTGAGTGLGQGCAQFGNVHVAYGKALIRGESHELSTKRRGHALRMHWYRYTTMKSSRIKPSLANLGARLPRLVDQPTPEAGVREKGPKAQDSFEVWHHHASVRRPAEWALMLQFDQRR